MIEAAALFRGGWRLQPYVPKAATLCAKGCNPMYQVAESLLDLSSSNGSRTNSTVNLSRVSAWYIVSDSESTMLHSLLLAGRPPAVEA